MVLLVSAVASETNSSVYMIYLGVTYLTIIFSALWNAPECLQKIAWHMTQCSTLHQLNFAVQSLPGLRDLDFGGATDLLFGLPIRRQHRELMAVFWFNLAPTAHQSLTFWNRAGYRLQCKMDIEICMTSTFHVLPGLLLANDPWLNQEA